MNIKLYEKVLSYIKKHPKEWDQKKLGGHRENQCRTSYCFAGHVVHLSNMCFGERDFILDKAENLLEIEGYESTYLFKSHRTIADFEEFLKKKKKEKKTNA